MNNCEICAINDTITKATHTCEYCGYRVCQYCGYNEDDTVEDNAQYFIDHARIDEAGHRDNR